MYSYSTGHSTGASISKIATPLRRNSSQTTARTRTPATSISYPSPTALSPTTVATPHAARPSAPANDTLSVHVALRVRPLTTTNDDEPVHQAAPALARTLLNAKHHNDVIELTPGSTAVAVNVPGTGVGSGHKQFTFDYVFGQQSTQAEIYESSVVPLLDKFADGYNVTILAYGQTSSGKTYTMGTGMSDAYALEPTQQGIIPRAIHTLFQFLSLQPPEWVTYQVTVSYLELYNEDLIDLIAACQGRPRPPITIREDTRGRIYWSGVREEPVYSADDVFRILEAGSHIRQTNTTDMNEKSSRSHAIFSVSLRQERWVARDDGTKLPSSGSNPLSPMGVPPGSRDAMRHSQGALASPLESGADKVVIQSKFHFVDLAGSERLKRTNSIGDRAREGISINAGLLALGNVISALGDPSKRATHIPYRDSKLTRLLQDSLGGNSQTLMIACVSPAESNLNETLNTLKYANRARNIKNQVSVNQELPNDIDYLRGQINRLKNELHTVKEELKQYQALGPWGANGSKANNRISMPVLFPPGNSPRQDLSSSDQTLVALRKRHEALESEFEHLNDTYTDLLLKFNTTSLELAKAKDELHEKTQLVIDLQSSTLGSSSPDGRRLSPMPRSPITSSFFADPKGVSRIPSARRPSMSSTATPEHRNSALGLRRLELTPRRDPLNVDSLHHSSPDLLSRSVAFDASLASPSAREMRLETELASLRRVLENTCQNLEWHQSQLGTSEKYQKTQERMIQDLRGQLERSHAAVPTGPNFAADHDDVDDLGSVSPPPGLSEDISFLSAQDNDLGKVSPPPGLSDMITSPQFSSIDGIPGEGSLHIANTAGSVGQLMAQLDQAKQELAELRLRDYEGQQRVQELVQRLASPHSPAPADILRSGNGQGQSVAHGSDDEADPLPARWETRATIHRLERENHACQLKIQQLTDTLEAMEQEHKGTKRSPTASPSMASDMDTRLNSQSPADLTTQLETQLHETAVKYDCLMAESTEETATLRQSIGKLQSQLASEQEALAVAQADAEHRLADLGKAYEQRLASLDQRVVELDASAREWERKWATAEEAREAGLVQHERLALECEDKKRNIEELEQQIEALVAQLPNAEADHQGLSLGNLGSELHNATQGQLGSTARSHTPPSSLLPVESTGARHDSMSSTFQELQDTVARLQDENAAMCDQLVESEKAYVRYQARDRQQSGEFQQMAQDLQQTQREVVDLKGQLEVLQTQHDQGQVDLERSHHELMATQRQLRETQQAMTQLNDQHESVQRDTVAHWSATLHANEKAYHLGLSSVLGQLSQCHTRFDTITQAYLARTERMEQHCAQLELAFADCQANLRTQHQQQLTAQEHAHRADRALMEESNLLLRNQLAQLTDQHNQATQQLAELQDALRQEISSSEARIALLRTAIDRYQGDAASLDDPVYPSNRSVSETETRVGADDTQDDHDHASAKDQPTDQQFLTLRSWQSQLLNHQATIAALTDKLTALQDAQRNQLTQAHHQFAVEREMLEQECATLRSQLATMEQPAAQLTRRASVTSLVSNVSAPEPLSAATAAALAMTEQSPALASSRSDPEANPLESYPDVRALSDSNLHKSYTSKVSMNASTPSISGSSKSRLLDSQHAAVTRDAQLPAEPTVQATPAVLEASLSQVSLPVSGSHISNAGHDTDEPHVAELEAKIMQLETDKQQLHARILALEYEVDDVNSRKDLVAKHLEAAFDRQHQQQLARPPPPTDTDSAIAMPVPAQPSPISRSFSFLTKGLRGNTSAPRPKDGAMAQLHEGLSGHGPLGFTSSGGLMANGHEGSASLGPLPPTPTADRSESTHPSDELLASMQAEITQLKQELSRLNTKNQHLTKTTNTMEEELLHVADLNDQLEEELSQYRLQSSLMQATNPSFDHGLSVEASMATEHGDADGLGDGMPRNLLPDSLLSSGPIHHLPLERHPSLNKPQSADNQQLQHLMSEVADHRSKVEHLQVLVDEQQSKIQRQESTVANLELKLREAETMVNELQAKIQSLESDLAQERELVAKHQASATDHSAGGSKDYQSNGGPSRPRDLTVATPSLADMPTTPNPRYSLTTSLKTPTYSVAATPTTMKYTDAEVTQMRSRISSLESDMQVHLNLIQNLETTLTEMEQDKDQCESEMAELRQKILSQTSEIKTLRDQLHGLNMQLDEAKNWADLEKRKLEMLKLKNRELSEEIAELKTTKKSSGGFLCF
ncbi:hypothetical protein H4R34_003696 [Dimargaris verticillata]|uniref:Kinesin motor domain-containing protein n=1 Tax=Dimargaris verticillata TaxID=2761393 RepID=A0A9W8ECD5_9FUNG|nr:hypothetical protein H4R34_003696 [Dimargaris verticillata]